ncbi:alpha/beta-hydrolase [Lizonia empirigonia]|nr:alpha/beta-hydrolase [Lizonia empirigonia]
MPPALTLPRPGTAFPRILLVHGVQTPALGMLPLATALRARCPGATCVLLDLWGHGLSDTPVVPHETGLFHGLLDALLTRLGWREGVHVVGFSFGAVLSMGFVAGAARGQVASMVLVAPVGLVRGVWFGAEERVWLGRECGVEDEGKAAEWVLRVLEGGKLVMPCDWRERVGRGEVVAEAVREWQMREHAGHEASVVGIFRDGGVVDNDEVFVEARKTGVPSLVVLGADDDLSTEKDIKDFGIDVRVVPDAGHAVVREKASEVAEHIAKFWSGLQ